MNHSLAGWETNKQEASEFAGDVLAAHQLLELFGLDPSIQRDQGIREAPKLTTTINTNPDLDVSATIEQREELGFRCSATTLGVMHQGLEMTRQLIESQMSADTPVGMVLQPED